MVDLFTDFLTSPEVSFTRRQKAPRYKSDLLATIDTSSIDTRREQLQKIIEQRITQDVNRAETAETPWVGALDPFGDV